MKTKLTPLQFINKQYLWSSFKERILPELTDEKIKGILSEYILPRKMSDAEIKEETKSIPIDVKYFASILQRFLEEADKNKVYIFHIQTSKEVVAFGVGWDDGGWGFRAYDFDDDGDWNAGGVFVSFATSKTKTLDTSDSLKLRKLVAEIKEVIKKYE